MAIVTVSLPWLWFLNCIRESLTKAKQQEPSVIDTGMKNGLGYPHSQKEKLQRDHKALSLKCGSHTSSSKNCDFFSLIRTSCNISRLHQMLLLLIYRYHFLNTYLDLGMKISFLLIIHFFISASVCTIKCALV